MKLLIANYKKIFAFLCLIGISSAINNPIYFPDNFDSLRAIVIFLRGIMPLILLPFLLLYLFINIKKINIDIIYKLFFIYLIAQLPYFFYQQSVTFNDIYWVLCGLSVLIFFLLVQNEDRKLNLFIFKFFVFLIILICSKFTFDLWSEYITNYYNQPLVRVNFYGFETMAPEAQFFGQSVPRSSGLSRLIMVIWLALFTCHIFLKLNNKIKFFFLMLPMIFLAYMMFHLQSRLMFIFQSGLIVLILFIPIYKIDFLKKFLLLITLFIIPYIIHLVEPQIRIDNQIKLIEKNNKEKNLLLAATKTLKNKTNLSDEDLKKIEEIIKLKNKTNPYDEDFKKITEIIKLKNKINLSEEDLKKIAEIIILKKINLETNASLDEDINLDLLKKKELIKDRPKIQNERITHMHSTGRIEMWKKTINLVKDNNFLGFGPQADRRILNQNVSSLIFYSLICGGIISFIPLILIVSILIFRILKYIFINKIFLISTNGYYFVSILLIGLLFVRGIGEITFGIFGIDMILFFISYNILSKLKIS